MKTIFYVASIAFAASFLSANVYADAYSSSAPLSGSTPFDKVCANELQTFCQNVQPGDGRLIQCLQAHPQELSDNCSTALQGIVSLQSHDNTPSNMSNNANKSLAPAAQ
jgi:Cysteine rich repeat